MTQPALAKTQLPITNCQHPPYLYWPVSRNEFYRSICLALVPAFLWGLTIFGSRTLAMLLLAIAATTFTYFLLKHWLRWQRGQPLMYIHCLLSVLVLVALAHPTWPIWIITSIALLLPVILAVLGGPGRERIHVAVALVLAIQYMLLPALPASTYRGKGDAILARDRLFMGDIRNQAEDPAATLVNRWPNSRDLGGDDAVVYVSPAQNAANTLDQLADLLPSLGQEELPPRHPPSDAARTPATRSATRPATRATTGPSPSSGLPVPDSDLLSREQVKQIDTLFDRALTRRLPAIDAFLWGMAPNRIGAASVIAMTFAGLYLSYRYILRPRSVLFFLSAFIAATAIFLFTPATFSRVGPLMLWEVIKTFPGQIVTLFNFLLINSDVAFAGVIILALPGTEPLTPRARRIFLALAALGAAALHRLDPTTPAATLTLCLMMPVAPLFDRLFGQKSWLNGTPSAHR